MKKKAIALISGGLDSLLAARVIMDQGIDLLGVVFVMQFASRDVDAFKSRVRETARDAGVPVKFKDISEEFLHIVKNPRHGYGANLNPCIDCKILMLSSAKKIMKEENAGFIITGEVLGERPMSQRKDALDTIAKEAEVNGYLLRPLSAKLLEETIPEKEGIVDRDTLLDISGRSRARQLQMAEQFGLKKFFTPAGGCLLTDPIFSRRLKDLMDRGSSLDPDNISLLKYGRHFRLDERTKAVVGRDKKDNEMIRSLKREGDLLVRLSAGSGPDGLLRGETSGENIKMTASLIVSHSRKKNEPDTTVAVWRGKKDRDNMTARSMPREKIEKLRI